MAPPPAPPAPPAPLPPTATASTAAPSPFPAYVLVNTTRGYAATSEDYNGRIAAGCIDRFHLNSDNAVRFDYTSPVCGVENGLRSQIAPLFDLYKSDIISGDLLEDGSYVIQVYSSAVDERRRDFIKRRNAWTFTYNGVIPSSSTSSAAASSSAPTSTAAASASASASASDEAPVESSSSAAPAATESAVQPVSVTANLYQAGASAASVLTFGSVVAAMALLF
ncbi:hypothetical protein HDU77_003251 [Chytriomyces hyalinus]|nr:hypothetical protein HDU77_003251 [Chytriomyces hyalinus]